MSSTAKKIFIYGAAFLVVLSIVLASYFDKDNNLKDEAVKMGDSYYCKKIKTGFIKEKCFEIVNRKKGLLEKCRNTHGELAKECNNLAY